MDQKNLKGKRVAVLVDLGFEESELTGPMKALKDAGARPEIVSPQNGKVKSWQHDKWGQDFPVDVPLDRAKADDYEALLLPGGVMNPDKLRMNEKAVHFVRAFFDAGKPVAAICHGPWMVVEGGGVRGRKMTSWPSLKTDIQNAGGVWVNEPVVVDNGLVTSRKPDDLPQFNEKMCEEFAEGIHRRAQVPAGAIA
jgi:protease I